MFVKGKHFVKKDCSRITVAVVLCLTILMSLASTGATAYLLSEGEKQINNFTDSFVACQVQETMSDDNKTKSNVYVKNTGDTEAFIRAAIVVNWYDVNTKEIFAYEPTEGTDYTLDLNLTDTGWFDGKDGYYYYRTSVAAETGETTNLINIATVLKDHSDVSSLRLQITVVAEAIQAIPYYDTRAERPYYEAWKLEKDLTLRSGVNKGI